MGTLKALFKKCVIKPISKSRYYTSYGVVGILQTNCFLVDCFFFGNLRALSYYSCLKHFHATFLPSSIRIYYLLHTSINVRPFPPSDMDKKLLYKFIMSKKCLLRVRNVRKWFWFTDPKSNLKIERIWSKIIQEKIYSK